MSENTNKKANANTNGTEETKGKLVRAAEKVENGLAKAKEKSKAGTEKVKKVLNTLKWIGIGVGATLGTMAAVEKIKGGSEDIIDVPEDSYSVEDVETGDEDQ